MQRSYRYCARECLRAELGDCTLSCSIRNYRHQLYHVIFILFVIHGVRERERERVCVYILCVCERVLLWYYSIYALNMNIHFCVLIASISPIIQ